MARRRAAAVWLTLFCMMALPACSAFVQYADSLRQSKRRTPVVRYTAQLGAAIGAVVGLPISVVGLPVSYPVYLVQESQSPETTDPSSTMLFPLVVLAQAGSMLGAPFDLIEYSVYRAWQPEEVLSGSEQEELEQRIDDNTLPRYPVTPIYPKQDG